MKQAAFGALVFVCALLVPSTVRGQSATTGAIAGVVRDTTGAVLPGVTVEAASPALIEKVRVGVTDNQGNYKIVDLRPGTYSVTFTLPGFATFKREGIELTTGFTATANAEMRVGAIAETVTVTGASPVVDIQNVRSQKVLSQEVLDALPTAQTITGIAQLTLGASNVHPSGGALLDVGGSKGDGTSFLSIHGTRRQEQRLLIDGLSQNIQSGGAGDRRLMWTNQVAIQETIVVTGAGSPELETAGMTVNAIPREGGNTFKFYFMGAYANDDLQEDNLTDEIRRRGVSVFPGVKQIYDWGVGVGGPIVRDRLWFYSANRKWGSEEFVPGAFYNKSTNPFLFEPDLNRPAHLGLVAWDVGVRLTWQAATKHKIAGLFNYQKNCQCHNMLNQTRTAEGSSNTRQGPHRRPQVSWSYTATNQVLFEAGVTYNDINWFGESDQSFRGIPRIRDQATGIIYGDSLFGPGIAGPGNYQDHSVAQRFSASYVTGSHAIKVGQMLIDGTFTSYDDFGVNGNTRQLWYEFRAGRPISLQQYALPAFAKARNRNIGVYAQDQWTIKRLTLNLGARYDHVVGWVPAGTRLGGPYVPASPYDRVDNVPNFNDVSPRVGAAYDLFGNGKTAIKGYIGRYVAGEGSGTAVANHPSRNIVSSVTRTWNDANGNFDPDCNLASLDANGECGPVSNRAFGQPFRNTFNSPDVVEGWGTRMYNWQATVGVQHELTSRVAVDIGYFRTWYGNFTTTDNELVTPQNYDPYCITAPTDPRLPTSGNRLCGLYNISPARFGAVRNLVVHSSKFGKEEMGFDGVDIAVNSRFGRGGVVQGGVSTGRLITDTCYVVDSPEAAREGFCRSTPPWSAGTQVKASGVFPLPWWGIEPSFTFQNVPGGAVLATWNAPNSLVVSGLGRNLAGCPAVGACTATVAVGLVPPSTMFLDRVTQLDLRFAKLVRLDRGRVRGTFDIYNVFNSAAILQVVQTYGPTWLRPTNVQGGRLFKFTGTFDF